jgi:hypothetical protein
MDENASQGRGLRVEWSRPMTIMFRYFSVCSIALSVVSGCQWPSSYAGRGTGLGALGGAGIGALIGRATGHTAAGALIGAGVGAVAGNVTGTALDDIDARNRAQIAARLGRQVAQGAATPEEVVAMTQAGVGPQLIINYVDNAGMAQPITAQDVIYLHEQGVTTEVIQAMQTPRVAQRPVEVLPVAPPRQTVIIEEGPGGPYYYPYGRGGYGVGGCH